MILMIGIDHTKAGIDQRSAFALTRDGVEGLIPHLKKELKADGVVILNTCNRFEVWINGEDVSGKELFAEICEHMQLEEEIASEILTIRQEEEAVRHLFYLACGMESAIFAEDQILTQVKNALAISRNLYCAGSVLEVLFRMAVTSAKKIKSEVRFSRADETAIDGAIRMMQEKKLIRPESKCMVIGNGEMGQISALRLKRVCRDVKVTVRQYHSGEVKIPAGCDRMDYGKRMAYFPLCDIIVSATASPHYTIHLEDLQKAGLPRDKTFVLVDLAVPRDIDPAIPENFSNIKLFNIDDFKSNDDDLNAESKKQAEAIMQTEMNGFYDWLHGREIIPRIQGIQNAGAEDLVWRMQQLIRRMDLQEEQKRDINTQLQKTSAKVIGKLLFALRSDLSEAEFQKCVEILEHTF